MFSAALISLSWIVLQLAHTHSLSASVSVWFTALQQEQVLVDASNLPISM